MPEVWDKVTSFKCLYKAALSCRKNVMWKSSVAGYIANNAIRTITLSDELRTGRYRLSPYSIFYVHERKERMIVATKMRDRVVQRSICDNYLYDQLAKEFIYDNAACQKGKGTDFARTRLEHHMRSYFNAYGYKGYALKIDIKNYFGSTSHAVAKQCMRKRIDDTQVADYVCMVIDSFDVVQPGYGIGLGSELSQLIELCILDDIDHMITGELQISHYVRYMDDLILIHHSKEHLIHCRERIREELAKLELSISESKTFIQPISQEIHFLGFSFRLLPNGTVTRRLLPGRVGKARRRLKAEMRFADSGQMTYEQLEECYKATREHMSKCTSQNLARSIDEFYLFL